MFARDFAVVLQKGLEHRGAQTNEMEIILLFSVKKTKEEN